MITRVHRAAMMGTVLEVKVVGSDEGRLAEKGRSAAVERVVKWFERVETDCSRFNPESELRRLCRTAGIAVPVSRLLFQAIEFAVAVAEETGGAFDPTIGGAMQKLGFDKEFRSGVSSPARVDDRVTYADIELDPENRTITLHRPLLIDLGAVAKGLAIDLGAQELTEVGNFAIDAGGDLYLGGLNERGEPWSIGIRHPRDPGSLLETVSLTNMALCTSGDYERRTSDGSGHHVVNPQHGTSTSGIASVSTMAKSAMVADALGTAAMVLGVKDGLALLTRHGVEGLMITDQLQRHSTAGWPS
jgi:thiamine biosynthesis lipoprotein